MLVVIMFADNSFLPKNLFLHHGMLGLVECLRQTCCVWNYFAAVVTLNCRIKREPLFRYVCLELKRKSKLTMFTSSVHVFQWCKKNHCPCIIFLKNVNNFLNFWNGVPVCRYISLRLFIFQALISISRSIFCAFGGWSQWGYHGDRNSWPLPFHSYSY